MPSGPASSRVACQKTHAWPGVCLLHVLSRGNERRGYGRAWAAFLSAANHRRLAFCLLPFASPPFALFRKIASRRHFFVRFFGGFAIGIWEEVVCGKPD